MKLKSLTEKLDIVSSNADMETEISSVCYDSRKACQGSLFTAIKGLESDGHSFIPKALELGAAVIVCEDVPDCECSYVQVEDSRLALALMSSAFYGYPSKEMKMVGVTGTSGKTTATHLIKHVLEDVYGAKVGMIGTNGNYIGNEEFHTEHTTPESLELQSLFRQMADAGCGYAVMEVSSHSLAMNRVAGIHFETAAYTNLSRDHLDFHITMDNYAAEKKKIFSMCGTGCINLDDDYSAFMLENSGCPMLTYSIEDESADFLAYDIDYGPESVDFTVRFRDEKERFHLGIPGKFSVYNALTVISVCSTIGMSLADISASLATADGVKGRVEPVPVPKGQGYSVLIDYSHKPDGLEKVLKTLRPVTKGRLISLFGCGGDRDRTKRPIMASVAAELSDFVVITSDNPRTENPNDIISEIIPGMSGYETPYIVEPDRIKAIHRALDNANAGDVVLLAGKGHEDYQIIGHTKHHMDEREIVADYFKEKGLL